MELGCPRCVVGMTTMRSWHRPLGRFSPIGLGAVLWLSFALFGIGMPLIAEWGLRLAVGVLVGFTFGLAVGEIVVRLKFAEWVETQVSRGPTPAIRLSEDDGLPPPGFVVVTCERCHCQGAVPAELATGIALALCTRCLAETGGR